MSLVKVHGITSVSVRDSAIRCSRVKTTGSATNTRLDSFVMEADRMWELTVRERLCLFRSPIPLSVAFSVLRNWPRCL
uniref:Uncharacterized protein n=1 Tax=Poecilia reticulata TaxID=8081 RepID=A0A3P9NX83_POERE